jgi:hypothetical protein
MSASEHLPTNRVHQLARSLAPISAVRRTHSKGGVAERHIVPCLKVDTFRSNSLLLGGTRCVA